MRAGPSAARSPWRAILPDLTALRVRDYRLLWLGMLATSALMPVQFITQVLWVQEVAGESTRLLLAGVLGAARGGAMLLTSVISGALADRMDRRRLLLIAPCLGFLVNGAIALLMLRGEGGAGTLTLFFLLSFAAGAVLSIDAPARQAMIPQIVGREHLGNAVALDAVAVQLAFPLGPLLAGFLIAEVSFGGAYLAGTLGYIIVFLCVLRMRYRGTDLPPRPPSLEGGGSPPDDAAARDSPFPPGRGAGGVGRPRGSSAGLAASILDGIAYARRTPTVLWLLLLLLAVMSVGFPAVASLGPVWVTQVLGLSYGQFGVFAAFWGIGALVASAAMTHVGHFPRKGWLTGAAAVGFAACVVVWGFSRSVPLSALMNACLGGLITTTQVSARSLVQRTVPNAIQGRVLSLFLLTMATAQVMTLPFAALAQRYSLAVVVPAMGWLCLALALAIVLLRPEVRRAGHTPPGDGPAHTPHA